jgi:hypothetical protein
MHPEGLESPYRYTGMVGRDEGDAEEDRLPEPRSLGQTR